MTLQNVIWGQMPQELYYRGNGVNHDNSVTLGRGDIFCTDTYMNLFDLDFWMKYTRVQEIQLKIEIQGMGAVCVQCFGREDRKINETVNCNYKKEILISIPRTWKGKLFFSLKAQEEVRLFRASFETKASVRQNVRLAIVICTFRRERQLRLLLKEILKSKDALHDMIQITVVDNASELVMPEMTCLSLHYNSNTGGAGGFARGMAEIEKNYENYPASHVLLMDDDVILEIESILRLYALLSYMREEYQKEIVAGRMFRLDDMKIQYTAAEIWNGGEIRHVGCNLDMTKQENLQYLNDNRGAEYGGWWFNCIPYDFIKKNRPFPFFLHCDDVEYGLRHGGTPVILNGIQVWHETYEYRQDLKIAYYDMRNMLIVNAMYGQSKSKESLLVWWKEKITKQHVKQEYLMEWVLILGMNDFLKGAQWFMHHDSEKWNKKIEQKLQRREKKTRKIHVAIAWRIVYLKLQLKIKKVAHDYYEIRG